VAKNRIWVCAKCKNSACLAAFLKGSGSTKVKKIRCQKICKGPVAGIEVDGRMEWFARVDRAKPMVALLKVAVNERKKLPRALEHRRIARRSGWLIR
jgi:hypothetical protein